MRLFEDHSLFSPGHVMWDNLVDLDEDLPLHEQDSLIGCEDVLTVRYPNKVLLDVSYLARSTSDAFFLVAVVPPSEEWDPVIEQRCVTLDEVKDAVLRLAQVARDWGS